MPKLLFFCSLLAAKAPFPANSPMELAARVAKEEPLDLLTLRPDLPADAARIVRGFEVGPHVVEHEIRRARRR